MNRTLQRFLVFCGDHHYPLGGWFDYKHDFEFIYEALNYVKTLNKWEREWWHIVDAQCGVIVKGDGDDE